MTTKPTVQRSRGWCFTINNWDDEDLLSVYDMFADDYNCTYLVVGFEIAPRTGTKHLQCYIYYTNPLRKSEFSNKRHMEFHFEPQKSKKNVAAYVYCMESGDYVEYGERPRQGHRTDLEVIKQDLIKGVPMKDISKSYFSQWCQYRRSFDEFKVLHDLGEKYDTKLILFSEEACFISVKWIYQIFTSSDYIVDSTIGMSPVDFAKLLYSGKYRYVFYPDTEFIRKDIKSQADGCITENGIELFSHDEIGF